MHLLSKILGFIQHNNYVLIQNKNAYIRRISSLLITILMVFAASCSNQDDIDNMPAVLKIGILPDESVDVLLKRYTPLFQYLSKELDVPYDLKIPASYEDLLKQFSRGDIDLAYFGGFTFIQANHISNAVPLVMRDIDVRFTSYFFSRNGTPPKQLQDFKGKSFAFGSKLSTSGHLMPRYFLKEREIIPETFFSKVQYSGSHYITATWVRDGAVDIGVANSKIIDKMFRDGVLNQSDIQILWQTPPYPDYVWAIQPRFGLSTRTRITNAFLSLSPSNKEHAAILAGVDANGFLPASVSDFAQLDGIAHELGLMERRSDH